jgi:hypothetical protein
MDIIEELKKLATEMGGEVKEDKGIYTLEAVIAERKAFLSKKKLTYKCQMRVVEENKEVKFTEMLKESGFGMTSGGGGGDEFGMSPGFGFKAGTYKTGMDGREGTIEEQSNLFGKDYSYKFDYGKTRKTLEAKAGEAGYKFSYQITSIGL